MDGRPRSADVFAEEGSVVLVLPFEEFQKLRKEKPEMAAKMALNIAVELSNRLRITTNEVRVLEEG
jgi:CRP-like cAMP-binding protein